MTWILITFITPLLSMDMLKFLSFYKWKKSLNIQEMDKILHILGSFMESLFYKASVT